MDVTREVFESQRRPRFGAANPERMDLAFWTMMVRGHEEARRLEGDDARREGLLQTPTDVRRFFGQEEEDYSRGPIWTFDRMGATRTPLPDGRVIYVAGEHEDWYDPDFFIYNDVVVVDGDGSIRIFGYPPDVFPPTDFHSATLDGDRLILLGRLGRPEERRPGSTPAFALDLTDYRITPLPSRGEAPGWIHAHEAESTQGGVTIRGGKVLELRNGDPRIRRNFDEFAYDAATGVWSRLTDRRWRQFEIQAPGAMGFLKRPPLAEAFDGELAAALGASFVFVTPDALRPRSFRCEVLPGDDFSEEERLLVEGVPVSIKFGGLGVQIVIEGDLGRERADALAEEVRLNIEEEVGRPCTLEIQA